jgi:hypothetical protein
VCADPVVACNLLDRGICLYSYTVRQPLGSSNLHGQSSVNTILNKTILAWICPIDPVHRRALVEVRIVAYPRGHAINTAKTCGIALR